MDSIRLAKVLATHRHSVDIEFIDGGGKIPFVKVMSWDASTRSGVARLTEPDKSTSVNGDDLQPTGTCDVLAVVSFFKRMPIVMGFLFPEDNQVLFDRLNFSVDRHASDVYETIDKDGNYEFYHPSGTYIRIGTSNAHEDLTGQDINGKWKIDRNTASAVHVHMTVKNAGVQKASLDIDPSGNVDLNHVGNLTLETGGNATGTVAGTFDLTVTGNSAIHSPQIILDAPLTICTGRLEVDKTMDVKNTGGSTDSSTFAGTIAITGGDVKADSVGLKTHVHSDPQGGSTGTGTG